MAKKLSQLTTDQVARLDEWRDRWLSHGLSTQPADREGARAGVLAAYSAASIPGPQIFIWLRSPMEGAVGAAMLRRLHDQPQVGDQVWAQVWAQVGAQVRDQVGDQVGAQVRDQVRDQVWAQVGWGYACWGQHDAGWLSFYDYFRVVAALACAEPLGGLIRVAECCGWWWPFRGAVILTERPTRLQRDDRGRLHSEDGAALLYPDGWGIWSWHGVRVPERVIERPATITVADIEGEPNAEIRRVMVERFGHERYILESGAQLVHSDETGALYRKEFADDEPLTMVHVVNSTAEPDGEFKKYMLRVPPDVRTAREAVAWTFGLAAKQYRPQVET